jgi:hypothetical protein
MGAGCESRGENPAAGHSVSNLDMIASILHRYVHGSLTDKAQA